MINSYQIIWFVLLGSTFLLFLSCVPALMVGQQDPPIAFFFFLPVSLTFIAWHTTFKDKIKLP